MEFAGSSSPHLKDCDFKPIDPFKIFDINGSDCGRESLGILNNIDFGRESLDFDFNTDFGRLNISDLGRESLGILNLENIDIGRESLGVEKLLSLHSSNVAQIGKLPNILISEVDSNTSSLNKAFIANTLPSEESSGSSVFFSFNSESLGNCISRISSVGDTLNEAFDGTSLFLKKMGMLLKPRNSSTSSLKLNSTQKHNVRLSSLPCQLETQHTKDEDLDDLVFMEANHLASRIADGSIYDTEDMLDDFPEPEELNNIIENEEEAETNTVWKTVDKFIPESNQSKSSNSTSSSSSKEAIEKINRLSEIINETGNDEQKTECQQLLSNLTQIVLANVTIQSPIHLDDSGHSSIESLPIVPTESYEVLDLRKKSSSTSNIEAKECIPLDLSLKSKSFASPKTLPPKAQKKNLTKSLTSSLPNCASIDNSLKLKTKKNESLGVPKRGPMKAVLPVNNMAKPKNNLKVTPTRAELCPKMKQTSTPISECSMKPMAQSTPDNVRSFPPISPLARPSCDSKVNNLKGRLNLSGSKLPLNKTIEKKKPVTLKRSSSGEVHKPLLKPLTRSSSFGGKLAISNKSRSSLPAKSVLKENNIRVANRGSLTNKSGKEN